jgi:hypothetical protein
MVRLLTRLRSLFSARPESEHDEVVDQLVAALSAAHARVAEARENITYPPARRQDDRLLANIAAALRAAGEPI